MPPLVRLPRKRTYTSDDLHEVVADVLAQLKSQGIVQQDVADALGVRQTTVSQASLERNVKLARRILEHYAGATIVEERVYRVVPSGG